MIKRKTLLVQPGCLLETPGNRLDSALLGSSTTGAFSSIPGLGVTPIAGVQSETQGRRKSRNGWENFDS